VIRASSLAVASSTVARCTGIAGGVGALGGRGVAAPGSWLAGSAGIPTSGRSRGGRSTACSSERVPWRGSAVSPATGGAAKRCTGGSCDGGEPAAPDGVADAGADAGAAAGAAGATGATGATGWGGAPGVARETMVASPISGTGGAGAGAVPGSSGATPSCLARCTGGVGGGTVAVCAVGTGGVDSPAGPCGSSRTGAMS
jgi:hypothetical protein